jgi:hypothetical protein
VRTETSRGLTVRDVAKRYRVSPDKVRAWIRRGELAALNTADAASPKPRFIIVPESLERFERGRSAAEPKPAPRRKRKPIAIDFFPD